MPTASRRPGRTDGEAGELAVRLGQLTLADEQRLARRLERLRRVRDPARRGRELGALAAAVEAAERRVAARRASVPVISYPTELPVAQRKDDLAAAIRDNQVVVVAGETGSGKTTQLPKICLEIGRGVRGRIGHTQPRRLAARTVADRVAEELGTPVGDVVGWKVRFTDAVGERTLVKVMTDGILLAELQHDRDLLQYDTIVLDEAHERSLTIDFLLGYLKRLLPRRPDLKVVVTSATIDPARFSSHFGDAPVVEVSGRSHPIEVRYRPYGGSPGAPEGDDRDQVQAVLDAVEELHGASSTWPPGDVLVFLSGEREIRDTAEALRRARLPDTEVLPLYARLSVAEQHRVFAAHPGRRIVLATNVAETSLTVPGIRCVIDAGTARISRYSARLKVQRLPIEPVSQASADQRAGRCGRTSDGIAIRLYGADDYAARPRFTDPEILRTNLASVVLAMAALGLGDVAEFPFLDPPDRRHVRDGVQLLEELGALDPDERDRARRLTTLGRRLAALPVDPRLGRMVLEAERLGCVREVLVIAAALSIQDPRERPADQRQAADERHRRFADDTSDFLALWNLWQYLREQQRALSSSAFRRLCRAEFLHYLRVREWQDLVGQLREAVRGLGVRLDGTGDGAPASPDAVHQALLAGLLSHIGLWDPQKREYAGARGARFAPWPGSALARKPPRWVMAGELVETTRLWGRDLARIDPDWVEPLAGHLVTRSCSEPHWSRRQGAVLAYEKVLLYGVPVVTRRRVAYGSIDPELSRELFIRHALVEGDWDTRHAFLAANRALVEDVEELENRARRRDILVGEDDLFAFYDARIPADVVSARHFDAWWKRERQHGADLLTFSWDVLVADDASVVSQADYPDTWRQDRIQLALTYCFEPGDAADGVTVHVPLATLNQVRPDGFDWQVPGLRLELVTALIRSLPKTLRVAIVPAPDRARAVLAALPREPDGRPLVAAVAAELLRQTGVQVPADSWDVAKVPDHLRMTFRVEDEHGGVLGEGKDLDSLSRRLAARLQAELSSAADDLERSGLTGWDFGPLPRTVQRRPGGQAVVGHPALVEEDGAVAVRVLGSADAQDRAMRRGTRQLLLVELPSPVRWVAGQLSGADKLALSAGPYPEVPVLLDDCAAAAVDALVAERGGPVWDGKAYAALRDAVQVRLPRAALAVARDAARVLAAAHGIEARIASTTSPSLIPALTDVRAQLAALVPTGFVAEVGAGRLPDLLRYLRAVERRLDVLPTAAARDRERTTVVQQLAREYGDLLADLPPERRGDDDSVAVRWMLEELRVSLFAQQLGTPHPVSQKRVRTAMDALRR